MGFIPQFAEFGSIGRPTSLVPHRDVSRRLPSLDEFLFGYFVWLKARQVLKICKVVQLKIETATISEPSTKKPPNMLIQPEPRSSAASPPQNNSSSIANATYRELLECRKERFFLFKAMLLTIVVFFASSSERCIRKYANAMSQKRL